jgi:hypothetical protein
LNQCIPYRLIYEDTRLNVMALSGLSASTLSDASVELNVDYDVFLADYDGPYLIDGFVGFKEMLRQWAVPWEANEMSALNGLTVPQFFLCWAWDENEAAKYLFDQKAIAAGWEPSVALDYGIVAAVSAARCVDHAQFLIATGRTDLAQESLPSGDRCRIGGLLD